MKRAAGVLALMWLTMGLVSGPALAGSQGPTVQLKAAVDEVLTIMSDKSISGQGAVKKKLDKVWTIINRYFADQEMTRRTLGVHWKKLNSEQKKEITHLFSELLRRSYLGRLELFEGQEIFYDREEVDGNFAKIDSHFFFQEEKIPLGYSLLLKDGQWMVYDMVIDGVSLIANYRRQFSKIIHKEGYQGLARRLRAKLKEERALEEAGG